MNINSKVSLHTGRQMPIIGLGTWKLKYDTANIIYHALKLGYSMFDTSGDYGTQPEIGEGIARSGVKRGSIYLVTKVEEDDEAYSATKKNLQELDLDYADLMLIHRPPETGYGEKLWEQLIRAKEEGLTKDIGVSNYSVEQIEGLAEHTGVWPVVNQIEWTCFGHTQEMLDFCNDNDIIIQAYSPMTRTERLDDERLSAIAERYGKSPAQIMIRWNLQLGTVPLPKANNLEHLKEDIDVFDFEISDEDMSALSNLNEMYSALGDLKYA
ncbi:aldo/keto reductase [Candidatus Parcubacteria bacterium]|nr:aldo/keto reductase [Candidatus Parcubacteria bacterium]